MSRKLKQRSETVRTERREKDGNLYLYELSVIEGRGVASYGIPLYSISVEMTKYTGETTRASVKEMFADAGRAICFFEHLVEHLATPIDLPYIVEDEL